MPSQLPRRQDRVRPIDWVKDDVINGNSSQIKLKFIDSLQIRTNGGVESNQGIKTVQMVVAPLPSGHRVVAGGVPERRCVQVTACGSSTGREEDDGEY
jgi:hypothetical protein